MVFIPRTALNFGDVKARKYEEKIVNKLLQRYGIDDEYKHQMLQESKDRCDVRSLSLLIFGQFFPTFPIHLQTTYFPNVSQECSVVDMFNRFGDTLLVLRYETIFESVADDDADTPCGMVFEWPYLKGGGGMVLHNQPINVDVPGSRFFFVSKRGQQLVMETLDVVLDTIDANAPGGAGWQPEFHQQCARSMYGMW